MGKRADLQRAELQQALTALAAEFKLLASDLRKLGPTRNIDLSQIIAQIDRRFAELPTLQVEALERSFTVHIPYITAFTSQLEEINKMVKSTLPSLLSRIERLEIRRRSPKPEPKR